MLGICFSFDCQLCNFLIKKIAENIIAPSFLATDCCFGLDYGVFKITITLLSGAVLILVLQPVLVLIPMLILAGFYL
jgi:hypothetical protein